MSSEPSPEATEQPLADLWAVVPAGGAGTRLWPLSRRHEPKFLRDLTGSGRSLLQGTRDRLAPLVEDRFLVVTGAAHRDAVAAQLEGLADRAVVAEPSPRDSMAAVGLAAALLERRDPDAVMGSFAADHVIDDEPAFREAVRAAVDVARDGRLVTVGVEPTSPATGFGYLRVGEPLADHPGAFHVEAFVEKPSAEVAQRYLDEGRHRWNAGMFVVRPGVLLDLLARWHPGFARDLRALAAGDEAGLGERVAAGWDALPRIALDHAVAEPAADAGEVATVPARFGWDDVGDFDSLATLLAAGAPAERLHVLGDPALTLAVDATGLAVPGSGRLVAVVGLDDVVVVDTPDAVLVTTRQRAQEVKAAVARLQADGRGELT